MEEKVKNIFEVPSHVYEEWGFITCMFSFISHISRNSFEVDEIIHCSSQEIIDYYNKNSFENYYNIFYQDYVDTILFFRDGAEYDNTRKRWTIFPYILRDELYTDYQEYIPYL